MFIFLDGDDVGPVLQILLMDDKVEDARRYSQSVSEALRQTVEAAVSWPDAEIVVAAGDDVVIRCDGKRLNLAEIEVARDRFFAECGRTMSAGFGPRASDAANYLRRAKLLGKNRVLGTAGNVGDAE